MSRNFAQIFSSEIINLSDDHLYDRFYMLLTGLLMSACTLAVFYYGLPQGLEKARTMAFAQLVALHMWNALNCRSETRSIFRMPRWFNPYRVLAMVVSVLLILPIMHAPFLRGVFNMVPLTAADWALILAISPLTVIAIELRKWATHCFF